MVASSGQLDGYFRSATVYGVSVSISRPCKPALTSHRITPCHALNSSSRPMTAAKPAGFWKMPSEVCTRTTVRRKRTSSSSRIYVLQRLEPSIVTRRAPLGIEAQRRKKKRKGDRVVPQIHRYLSVAILPGSGDNSSTYCF
jgi:hypothetical protein